MTAFALASTPFLHRAPSSSRPLCAKRPSVQPAHLTKQRRVQMQTDSEAPPPVADDALTPDVSEASAEPAAPKTSASELLKTLREDSASDTSKPKRSMLGVYRDVDGKSNVWAVEPLEETDTSPQISKVALIGASAVFIVIALLVLPMLPLTNADQL